MLAVRQPLVRELGVIDVEFGSLFWWNFWVVVQGFIVVAIVVVLALFVGWGRRKKKRFLESSRHADTQGHAAAGR